MAFLNPLFLLGGLAAAVPILLHLIRRHNARKIEFPTLMFLRKIDKKTIRYQKLRHLLLLLLRILALLLIVFAFMRPYRRESPAAEAIVGKSATVHVLALDNSMSMHYQDRWEQAQKAAADIVNRSDSGDLFAVLEFSDSTLIRSQTTKDKSSVLNDIDNATEPGDRPTRYAQVLRAAEKIALEAGTGNRIIHLISDFQKSGWKDEESEYRLSEGIELQSVDLGSDAFSNLAIRNVRLYESDQGAASTLDIQASIIGFGEQDRENIRISLMVDDRTFSEKTIPILAGGTGEIAFQVPNLKPGEHTLVLEMDDPALAQDNRFYITADVRGKIPVLLVENPEGRRERSSGFFLARALNIDRLSPYQVKTVSPRNLDFPGRILIWNSIPFGSTDIRRNVENFVRDGGGIIVVLGDSMRAAEFNNTFGTWLPVKMEQTGSGSKSTDDFALMTDIEMDHPIFQPFGKPYSGTFSSTRFYYHARLNPGPGIDVPARFDNGDPALVSISAGKGRVLIFASSADDSGNDLPFKAVYAPFWQQMVRYLENRGQQQNWLEIGDVIDPRRILSMKAFHYGEAEPDPNEAVAILDPAKQRLETESDTAGIITEKAGFYDIRSLSSNTAVAVNTSPAESDLSHRSADE
ncbi:MAG: BatA domain-containing protein, partial [Acidobacteriota bacterium]